MPGLQRARRGFGPGGADLRTGPPCCERGHVPRHRAEDLDLARPRGRLVLRTRPHAAGVARHHGLTFLLVPMDQPGRIEVRPIRQLTGTSEFNEVFFDGAHGACRACRRRRGQRLARRDEPPRLRARRLDAGPTDRLRRGVGAGRGGGGANGAADDPVVRDPPRTAVGRAADDAVERAADAGEFGRGGGRAQGRGRAQRRQAAVGAVASAAR